MDAAVIGGLVAALIIAGGIVGMFLWMRRRRSSVTDALRAVALDRMHDIVVPDGMGGEIHIEHLVLTARGVLVIDVKGYEGVVFASNTMETWTSIGASGRATFPNPLASLYDRVAAIRQLIREVEVAGFVVFPARADFSKGRPDHVLLPDDLLKVYARPEPDQVKRLREAFAPHWERLREAARPASG